MNVIVTINNSNQDQSLRDVFDTTMKSKKWSLFEEVENTYFKDFEYNDHHKVNKLIAQEIDKAVFDAEWKKLKYIVVITDIMYYTMQTK